MASMMKEKGMTRIEKKRRHEKRILSEMIGLYCKGKGHSGGLCGDCEELRVYAMQRCDSCPHMENKTFCSNCKTHCYRPEMRGRIRAVMRYSGPRMLLYHPVLLLRHVYYGRQDKGR